MVSSTRYFPFVKALSNTGNRKVRDIWFGSIVACTLLSLKLKEWGRSAKEYDCVECGAVSAVCDSTFTWDGHHGVRYHHVRRSYRLFEELRRDRRLQGEHHSRRTDMIPSFSFPLNLMDKPRIDSHCKQRQHRRDYSLFSWTENHLPMKPEDKAVGMIPYYEVTNLLFRPNSAHARCPHHFLKGK